MSFVLQVRLERRVTQVRKVLMSFVRQNKQVRWVRRVRQVGWVRQIRQVRLVRQVKNFYLLLMRQVRRVRQVRLVRNICISFEDLLDK